MSRLRDHLKPEELREANLRFFDNLDGGYLRHGPFGDLSGADVRQIIKNVSGRKLARIIDAFPSFEVEDIAENWSHFVALVAGTHVWPDANHRTAMEAFSVATARAFGLFVALDVPRARKLVTQSKPMRNADFLERGRYYSVAELSDPSHKYRDLIAEFEGQLRIEPVE